MDSLSWPAPQAQKAPKNEERPTGETCKALVTVSNTRSSPECQGWSFDAFASFDFAGQVAHLLRTTPSKRLVVSKVEPSASRGGCPNWTPDELHNLKKYTYL